MAEPERPLKTWAEIDASQRQECLCDFSRLTAPLREYKVVARVVAGSHARGGAVIMSRTYQPHEQLVSGGGRWMSEDVEVFSAASSFELRRGLTEAAANVGRFSDGEVTVEITQNVRARHVFVIQSTHSQQRLWPQT